jgi:hypothetical protein
VAESMLDLSEAAFYIKLIKLLNFMSKARQRGFSRSWREALVGAIGCSNFSAAELEEADRIACERDQARADRRARVATERG